MPADVEFRRLALALYRRHRRAGRPRVEARDLIGELVNAAHAIDLFEIQRRLRNQERVDGVIALLAPELISDDDESRLRARRAMPLLLKASDGYHQQIQNAARATP